MRMRVKPIRPPDDGDQPRAVPVGVLVEPVEQIGRPADVVPRVPVGVGRSGACR